MSIIPGIFQIPLNLGILQYAGKQYENSPMIPLGARIGLVHVNKGDQLQVTSSPVLSLSRSHGFARFARDSGGVI